MDNRKDYIPALESIEFPDGRALRVGFRYVEVARIAGRSVRTTYEVTALEEDREMAVRSVDGLFPIAVRLLLLEKEGLSRLTIMLTASLSGVYRLASPVIRPIIEQQAREILENVKANLESNGQ